VIVNQLCPIKHEFLAGCWSRFRPAPVSTALRAASTA